MLLTLKYFNSFWMFVLLILKTITIKISLAICFVLTNIDDKLIRFKKIIKLHFFTLLKTNYESNCRADVLRNQLNITSCQTSQEFISWELLWYYYQLSHEKQFLSNHVFEVVIKSASNRAQTATVKRKTSNWRDVFKRDFKQYEIVCDWSRCCWALCS